MFRTLSITALLLALAAPVAAADLVGTVVDAHDALPVAGVRVIALGSGVDAITDAQGRYRLTLPADRTQDDVRVAAPGEAPERALTWVGLRAAEHRTLHVFRPGVAPRGDMAWGAPLPFRPDDGRPDAPVSIAEFLESHPLGLTITGPLPDAIRVGRRMADSCSGNPIQRIDTVSLEEYVQGVLIPEIGVFRAVEGGEPAAAEVFKAFAVAARSYAVWFYYQDPTAEFHIDDTACNQRYEDARNEYIGAQVAATAGMIMVQAADPTVIDKFEYAASCGRHGSRPEYQDALVPDDTGVEACVGSWCGHNGCAGHEVNPALPDSGRCLVRGICQWGSVERSMRGDAYSDILAHYQPNLSVVTLGEGGPTRLVGFVRVGDVFAGAPVADVSVRLDTGEATTTDGGGFFAFEDVTPGLRTLDYSGGGIVPTTQDKEVVEGITNWASVSAELEGGGTVDDGPDAGSPDSGRPDSGAPDSGASDTGVPDAGAPDGGATTDGGVVGDTGDTGVDTGSVIDAASGPSAGAPSDGYVPLYTLVGADVEVERGCGVSGRAGARHRWIAALAMVAVGSRRRRRS